MVTRFFKIMGDLGCQARGRGGELTDLKNKAWPSLFPEFSKMQIKQWPTVFSNPRFPG